VSSAADCDALQGRLAALRVPRVQVVEACKDLDTSVDVVLVCTKAYDLETVGQELGGRIRPDTILITFQNGIGNVERLAEALGGPGRGIVIGGLTYVVATKIAPGVIHQSGGPKRVAFGPTQPPVPADVWARLQDIEGRMSRAQIQVKLVENVNGELWEKFGSIITFAGFTSATRRTIEPILREPTAEGLMRRCVASANGATVRGSIGTKPPRALPSLRDDAR